MVKKLILIVTTLAAFPAAADFAAGEMAQIITHGGRPVDCLSPIMVNKIDGRQRIVPAQGFKIEPGLHSINGRAILDTTFCKVGRGGNRGGYAPDLAMIFEAGKTYHVGYDHRSKNRDNWKLVVWKIE